MPCSISFSIRFNAQLFKLKVAFLLVLSWCIFLNKVVHKPLFPDVGHKWTCQGDNVVSPSEGIVVYSQSTCSHVYSWCACSHVYSQCACSHVCMQSVCLQSCLSTVSVPAVMSVYSQCACSHVCIQSVCLQSCLYTVSVPAVIHKSWQKPWCWHSVGERALKLYMTICV